MADFPNPFSRKSSEGESLREEIRLLKRAVGELTTLSELAFAIGGSAEPQEIIETLVDHVMRAVDAEQAVVTLVDHEAESANEPMKTNLRLVATSAEHSTYSVSDSVLGWMYLNKKPLLLNDPHNDDRFRGVDWQASIRSMMCIPLLLKSELTGMITIYNKKGAVGFTEDDQRLLAIIAAQSASLIENARLHHETMVLAHMREQQENAYEIQRNLLPRSSPEVDGYDIAGASRPAQIVGGDYFDFMPAVNDQWVICLGDVSGKGLPASLLMANLQATLRAQSFSSQPVDERIRRANRLMYENMDDERFATLFYAELDPRDHRVSFCNAGHDYPLLFSGDGPPRRLDTTGVAVGVIEEYTYQKQSVMLSPGDLLLIYSDGVTDATNRLDEHFGLERLIEIVEAHRDVPSSTLIEKILIAVNHHAGDAPQFDDLTLVAVKRSTEAS